MGILSKVYENGEYSISFHVNEFDLLKNNPII